MLKTIFPGRLKPEHPQRSDFRRASSNFSVNRKFSHGGKTFKIAMIVQLMIELESVRWSCPMESNIRLKIGSKIQTSGKQARYLETIIWKNLGCLDSKGYWIAWDEFGWVWDDFPWDSLGLDGAENRSRIPDSRMRPIILGNYDDFGVFASSEELGQVLFLVKCQIIDFSLFQQVQRETRVRLTPN